MTSSHALRPSSTVNDTILYGKSILSLRSKGLKEPKTPRIEPNLQPETLQPSRLLQVPTKNLYPPTPNELHKSQSQHESNTPSPHQRYLCSASASQTGATMPQSPAVRLMACANARPILPTIPRAVAGTSLSQTTNTSTMSDARTKYIKRTQTVKAYSENIQRTVV